MVKKEETQFTPETLSNTVTQTNPSPVVTEDALDKRIHELKNVIDNFSKPIWFIVSGVVIVLFLGFVTILVSMLALVNESNNFKMSAYQQLLQEVQNLQKK